MPQRLSASSAARIMRCPGSANLELAIPNWQPPVEDETADNAANRGTEMHSLFAGAMSLATKDLEHMLAAQRYVLGLKRTRRFKSLVETPMPMTWLGVSQETTADLVLYLADEIHVLDLKTGKIPVSPVDNYQLMFYAVTYGHLAPRAKGAWLHIVQPWAGVMEKWFVTAEELRMFMAEARDAQRKVDACDTTLSPGDHCMFCPANPHSRGAKGAPLCPSMMQLLYPEELEIDVLMEGL